MLNIKRFISITLTAFFIVSASVAQDSNGRASDAGTQRQARLDLTGFKTVYGSDGLEMRKKTLKDIGDAIAQGNSGDDIYAALEYMSMEGLKNTARERGNVVNNYPAVRMQVAAQLGKMGTAKASEILIQICNNETDHYVLMETFKSMGDIGINDNDNTVKIILWKVRTYNPRSPDSLIDRVVSSAVYALDKIDQKNNGFTPEYFNSAREFLDRVSKGHFSKQVQEYAKQVLEDILRRDSLRRQGN
jgi:hypothetical protein